MMFAKTGAVVAIALAVITAAPAQAAVRTITGSTTFNLATLAQGGYADEYAAFLHVGRLNTAEFSFTFDEATRVDEAPASSYTVSNVTLNVNGASLFDGLPGDRGLVTMRTFNSVDLYTFDFQQTVDLSPDVPGTSYLRYFLNIQLDPGFLADGNVPVTSSLSSSQIFNVLSIVTLASNMPYPDDGQNFVTLRGDNVTLSEGSGAPEPASWALLIIGFGASGALLRARKRQLAAG